MSRAKTPISEEVRREVFNRDGYRCRFVDEKGNRCCESGTELAHGIADTVSNCISTLIIWKEKYDERSESWIHNNVINHPLNLFCSCPKHNDYFNRGFKRAQIPAIIEAIHKALRSEGLL